ncbi:signal peptide [Acinetobacter baumannii]|nr:signal peptide [Acinetobacter baumannii]SSR29219.1 signal peptide [Acinetobacter baumannii]SSR38271.1 signal peptide [Acinetobacter baumannii]SSV31636.1 signal peptide [Acinetobacter baumannii]SSV37627.1 signal peptide [Acinetobacter baumannii]
MLKKTPHIILMSLLSSSLLLTACKKADEPAKTEQSHTSSSTDQVLEKLLCTRQISQNPYPIRILPS